MLLRNSITALIILLCTPAFGQHADEFIPLFNKTNLDGWKVYGTERWYVDKGELVCESGPDNQYGYLATEKEFKDFQLFVEFFQESDGNSGVFFHSQIDGTKITGWQAEIAPPGKHTGGIYESYGRGWLIQPSPEQEKSLKGGQWNKMKLQVKGNEIVTWLNGEVMIRLTDDRIGSASGKIALQIHDGGGVKIRWRGIAIRELTQGPDR